LTTEDKFLVSKFEFRGSFGMSLEGDCHEVEVTANLEVLVNFGLSWKGSCHKLDLKFEISLHPAAAMVTVTLNLPA
jgi:hypothetical protein